MSKSKALVIIESPGKTQKFKEYLGSNYEIMSTRGHIFDLPEKSFGVDLKNDFAATFVEKEDRKDVLAQLLSLCKKCNPIYIMTDLDTEGTGIAKNVWDFIAKNSKSKIYRATTSEITKSGINNAIKNCGDIDEGAVNAFLTRRILDRIAGYRTSFPTQMATGGRSAGRVQSAILRVISDREIEILNFKPEEYWEITAYLFSSKNEKYIAYLSEKIKMANEKECLDIYNKIITGLPIIESIDKKEVNVNPYPPFTTLPMCGAASSLFGWSAKKTMDVAQSLYSSGKCTYHRTDCTNISEDALKEIRSRIWTNEGKDYLPDKPKFYASKKGAQEAHECCRPTNIQDVDPHDINVDEKKLYEMIWKRTVASQMNSGKDERTKVITKISDYDFISNGNTLVFDGYRRVWNYSSSKETLLPTLFVSEKCSIDKIDKGQKFTQPPSRYSVTSLSKKCEEEQIARPATFANFIETLKDREYITNKNKSFEATELGMRVSEFLKKANVCFADLKFTASMEVLLDEIQEGKKTRTEVLTEFWERLKKDLEECKKIKLEAQETSFKCPKCSGKLLKKISKFGPFLSCSNYKAPSKSKKKSKKITEDTTGCDYKAQIDSDGNIVEKVKKVVEYSDFDCPKCLIKLVKRSGKFGDFLGCSNFSKGCKVTADLEGNIKEYKPKKKWFKKKKKDDND